MANITQFERFYGDLMENPINIELTSDEVRTTYKTKTGLVKSQVIPVGIYKNAVTDSRYLMKLIVNSMYVKDRLNCFIEKGVLYLDDTIPFSTQMNEVKELKKYFYFYYEAIRYNGEIGPFERLSNFGKIINPRSLKTEEGKNTSMLASIKLKLTKLNSVFITYVDERIDQIYASPEERLESFVDLTKPLGNISEYNIYNQLSELNNQIPILLEASEYMNQIDSIVIPGVTDEISKMNDIFKRFFQSQLDKERRELFNRVKDNAILKVEGKQSKTIDELDKEFIIKIQSYFKLLKDYYLDNKTAYDIIYNESHSEELIIARINSIYSFYGTLNPFKSKIADYKTRIETVINKKEDSNLLVKEYKEFLDQSLEVAETFAFTSCINLWKSHNNRIVYGMNSIFNEIGEVVENYNSAIKKWNYYEERKVSNNSEVIIDNQVKEQFESKYQLIIERIRKVYFLENNDNAPVNKDDEYKKLLIELRKLTEEIGLYLKNKLREESIQSIINGGMKNYTENDPEFDNVFNSVREAYDELTILKGFASKSYLFNINVIKKHCEENIVEYQTIIDQIMKYFSLQGSKEEYDNIINSLKELTSKTKIICENENKLLIERAELQKQKRLI